MEPLVWLGVYLAELFFFSVYSLWRFKRAFAWLFFISIVVSTVLVYRLDNGVWFYILVSFTLFRLFNFARIIKSRMHTRYLFQVTGRTSAALAVMTSFAIAFSVPFFHIYLKYLPYIQLLIALTIFIITVKNIQKLRFIMPKTYLVDRELPTVTVAIPARNETTDLQECLDAVLVSDYPKLEILVLDDCSQAKTAEIIRSYANKGVRFIQGEPPAKRWLAKNQAYEKLYQESSGELLLFCGVDVRFGSQTIRNMVNILHDRKKAMLSVLPKRERSSLAAVFMQPMRYWWELTLPRRLFKRPPVLSTCWLINRKALKKLGGFAAVSHTLLPEGYFARELIKTDAYSFIRSSAELQVLTVKNLGAQRQTSLRTLYPKIRRRPENALILTFTSLVFLFGPFVALLASIWIDIATVPLLVVTCSLLTLTHVSIVAVSDPANIIEAIFTFPLAVLIELYMIYVSMVGYEFFTVTWKDRNICIPVMHVIPKLPELSEEVVKS